MNIYQRDVILAILGVCLTFVSAAKGTENVDQQDLRKEAIGVLKKALIEEAGWVKVHAAEVLLFNNYPENVRKTFETELKKSPSPKYRIGAWRVLVRAAGNDNALRKKYMDKIIAALHDPEGSDRSHAAETLGKLGYTEDSPMLIKLAQKGKGTLQANVRWILANSGAKQYEIQLAELVKSNNAAVRGSVGYALRYLPKLSTNVLDMLVQACKKESIDSPARVYLFSALYVHSRNNKALHKYAYDELLKYLKNSTPDEKKEACCALAAAGHIPDISLVKPLLKDPNTDLRIFAANAFLRIERRQFKGLQWLDWVVICLYGAFMLGIGAYYSRKQTSTEEYFLASRNMNPYVIGISMFATLLSTISYLGNPGEIIKHGPMILCGYLAVPFTYLVVGYILIPRITKLRITSAYEILETRLGLSVRLLGSVIFILTRLVWMALLIYIAAKLMVAMLNWGPEMIPWVVIVAGFIAVVYTAMGGLRAVVITDVVQFFILMGGAIITIVLITIKMGGVSWFPTQWAPHWDIQPIFSWDLHTRVTVLGAAIASFCWWVCTAGSDQVVIQRYLATRNAKAARRAFLVNVLADMSISMILYTVGLALLGFFLANRYMIPDGKSLIADADFLFPRYIANYLPMGLAGLVVAGMFAAAMSSLDSGINSIVTVFTRDFVVRLRKKSPAQNNDSGNELKFAKYLVLGIGICIVLLSSQMEKVPGNIFEVTNKTNGLFVGPLFGLFFMSMFVKRATPFGTIIGAICGFLTAFTFAYWDKITGAANSLSFQLIIPAALIVQLTVGILLSHITIRKRKIFFQTS